jgi:hypothetical protein
MPYRGRDDRAVWVYAIARTTWPLHCQLAKWKSNEALFGFCSHWVWNLLKCTEELRFSMETVVWVRGECINGWTDFKTEDKTSVNQFADDNEVIEAVQSWLKATPKSFFLEGVRKLVDRWTKCCEAGGLRISKNKTQTISVSTPVKKTYYTW